MRIYGNQNQYPNELKRIERAPILEQNKETIIRFHNRQRAKGASDERIVKLSWQLRKIAYILGKPFEETTPEDVERIISEINRGKCTLSWKEGKEFSAWTKSDYARVLKQFYKWLRGTKETPAEVEWINTKLKQHETVMDFDLITWEDINELAKAADNPKDLAFIHFIYEAGARVGELLNIRLSDLKFLDRYARVRLKGKTGERWIPLVISVPYLAQYLNTHPQNEENDFLWLSSSDKNKNSPLRYAGAVMLIRKLFNRARIKKRHNPHAFRHSRATELARTLTEPQLRLYFGWEKSSSTPSVYTHLSGRDIDNSILKLNGVEDKKEEEKTKTLSCSICSTVNKPGANFCSKCGYGLSVKSVIENEEKVKTEMQKTVDYFMEIAKSPELMAEFERFKERM